MEGGGGDVASLEQDPFAVPTSVVARLAIDGIPLVAALDKSVIHGHGDRRDELPVCALSREIGRVLVEPPDRDRSRYRLAHGRAVVEELAGRLRQHLRLVVHARIEMDWGATRRTTTCASGESDNGREGDRPEGTPGAGVHARASMSGFGL